MNLLARTFRSIGLGLAVLVACPATARPQSIVEFATPTTHSDPSAIVVGPDGNLYFAETGHIGRTSLDGAIIEFPLTADVCRGSPLGVGSLAVGPDGDLWYTGGCLAGRFQAVGFVGKMTTQGINSMVTVPSPFILSQITVGPSGDLWYTYLSGQIVRVTPSGVITGYALSETSEPAGIAVGADGVLWFAQGNVAAIGRISTDGVITQFPLPSTDRRSNGIALGPDGNIWFTESTLDGSSNWIGRITPSGAVTEFPLPRGGIGASQIATGPDGDLWFTEPGNSIASNRVGRIDLTGSISELIVPTQNSAPTGIVAGPDGNVWFTEAAASKIGRINLDQFVGCQPTATALCLAAGRFRVESRWRRADSGLSAGKAVPITPDTGYFWFFNPSNVEVVVKVLNGCPIDDHHWFFAGGLTNVELTLTVTDTQTGAVQTYSNPSGTAFQPVQDTSAFATCP